MSEIKGNIPNYPDYFITSCGRIWSFKTNKFLKPLKNPKGYSFIHLYNEKERKDFLIHRLVAEAYIPNPERFDTVDHIDFCKDNNYLMNLRWMSREENSRRKEKPKRVKCLETGQIFDSLTEAAQFVRRDVNTLCACLKGKQKTCASFHWAYYEEE